MLVELKSTICKSVFTNNCELVSSNEVEDWVAFSDHRLFIVHTYFKLKEENMVKEEQYLCETRLSTSILLHGRM